MGHRHEQTPLLFGRALQVISWPPLAALQAGWSSLHTRQAHSLAAQSQVVEGEPHGRLSMSVPGRSRSHVGDVLAVDRALQVDAPIGIE